MCGVCNNAMMNLWIQDNKLFIQEKSMISQKKQVIHIENIENVYLEPLNERLFFDFMSNNFWNKGKPRISIYSKDRRYYITYQLTDNEANKLIKESRKILKQYGKEK